LDFFTKIDSFRNFSTQKNRKRKLTLPMMRRLREQWGIPAEVLMQAY